jgi:hypothetical protein
MSDETNDPAETPPPESGAGDGRATRRRVLMLGAVGAASVVSVRPALAATAASVLNCQIPVTADRSSWVALDGSTVRPYTPFAYPPAGKPFSGQDVQDALEGNGNLDGTDYFRSRAYLNYIKKLQRGTSGFTCYASLMTPR